MPIIQPVIRPPAEAGSVLIQVTTGCSSNSCTFCGAYLHKPFQVKKYAEIAADIKTAARMNSRARRVFLMDGDALALSNEKLIPILKLIEQEFPYLSRIASYANGYNICERTDDSLAELYAHKLKLIYIGLESGSQDVLTQCKKRATVSEMVDAVVRADKRGIKSSVILLLGLGGAELSHAHVRESIKALNQMNPRYLSFLSLMLIPGTPLYESASTGLFHELSSHELLQEMHDIIAGLELQKTIFRSDHASNYVALEGRFPTDKVRLLATLHEALCGNKPLRSELFRGL